MEPAIFCRLLSRALLPSFRRFSRRNCLRNSAHFVPFCIRQICGRCRDPATVGWRHPEVAQISAQQVLFLPTWLFFFGNSRAGARFLPWQCDRDSRQLLAQAGWPHSATLLSLRGRGLWRLAQFASRLRFDSFRSFAFGMFEKAPRASSFAVGTLGLRHVSADWFSTSRSKWLNGRRTWWPGRRSARCDPANQTPILPSTTLESWQRLGRI